jgi:hypothetical protein
MELLRWMGLMYARFVAVSVTVLSAWIFVVNLFELRGPGWALAWILSSGLVGAVGGLAYLLSLDGPVRFHTRAHRIGGWVAMLAAVILPTSLTPILIPLVVLLIPTLFGATAKKEPEDAVTSG